jgi:hypothetical protein
MLFVCCLIVVPLPPGENPCAVNNNSNIDTIQKHTQTLFDASKVFSLEVNAEKTKYMLLSRHQNARQNLEKEIGNRCFENLTQSDIWERRSNPDSGGN